MSAVEDFVEDTFDSVGDVLEAVGDAVEDVGEFISDAVDTVGDTIQAVIDDPIPVLLSIAGQAVGIPAPLTMAAITAARGGDLEDIVLSAGTAYILGEIKGGNSISNTVSDGFIEAGANETFAKIAGDSISKGLVNGTVAELKGGSFEDGFAGGFTGGLVSAGVGEVASYVKPDVIEMAMDSGLDLQDATALFNAGTRAFSSGISAEVTGRGDFATAFTNSAIGSGVDAGTRSLNATIDEQFRTAATDWNEKEKESETVEVSTTGAGIPDGIVNQVEVSSTGFDTPAANTTPEFANVLDDLSITATNAPPAIDEVATSDISVLPEAKLAEAPQGQTVYDFADFIGEEEPKPDDTLFANASSNAEVPEIVTDIAESLPTDVAPVASTEPVGGLNALVPAVDLDTSKPAVVSEAPVADNLLTAGLATEPPAEQPAGGLNAVAPITPEEKMATSMGLKPTDITKPLVATAGNLFKQTLTQKRRPPPRALMNRPAGGLQMAGARPARRQPPPQRMDLSQLTPIQKAPPTQTATRVAPPRTLGRDAKLSPITDIATLTSLIKKAG